MKNTRKASCRETGEQTRGKRVIRQSLSLDLRTLPRRIMKREGVSSLEVVMTTALIFPSGVFLCYHAINACRIAFSVVGTMTGSPLI